MMRASKHRRLNLFYIVLNGKQSLTPSRFFGMAFFIPVVPAGLGNENFRAPR